MQCRTVAVQDSTYAGQVRSRTGQRQGSTEAGQYVCRVGPKQDRTEAGQYPKQDSTDAGWVEHTLRPDLGNIFLFYEFLHGVISYVSKILFFQKMYIRILASLRTAF